MFDELNQQIAETKQKLQQAERMRRLAVTTREALVSQRLRAHELRMAFLSEESDVARLEGLSLTALWHTVLGNQAQWLEKERQELLAAKLKYDACQANVAMLKTNLAKHEQTLAELGDPAAQLQSLQARKEELLRQANQPAAQELVRLDEELQTLQTTATELQQAVQTGWETAHAFTRALDVLNTARTMSTLDVMGANSIAALKHFKIDEARDAIVQAQHWLEYFQQELRDVPLPEIDPALLQISFADRLSDFGLDGLFFGLLDLGRYDQRVHHKITDAFEHVSAIERQVREALRLMQRNLDETRAQLKRAQETRQHCLETV
jgi:hypothetical protein